MPVHILQISDVHFAAGGAPVDGRNPTGRLRKVLDAVRRERTPVDVIVVTGDLTDDGSHAGCRDLATALSPLGVPILAVPGNHDEPTAVRDVFGPDVLDVGAWRIVGIDTSRPDQIHGTIDVVDEMSRLDRYDRRPTVLAMHHPPVSPSTNAWFQLGGADGLGAAMARRPHVKVILSGHLHHPFESVVGGVAILGCPSTLIAFRHSGDDVVIGGADTTGARICTLHEDGRVISAVIQA